MAIKPSTAIAVRRFDKRFVFSFALSGLLALGLAAIQVIPTVEWLAALGPQLDNPQPVLDRHQGQGFFSRDILRDPSSAGVAVPEGSAYVGMFGLLAAALAVFHKSRSYVMFFAIAAAVAIAIAFGVQPVRWIVVHLPVIKAMKNARLILVADFAIAAMAGLGVAALEQPSKSVDFRKHVLICLSLASLALGFCIYEVHRATLVPVELMRSPYGSLIFLLAALALMVAGLRDYVADVWFPAALCGLCALEMLSFSYGYLGFTPAAEVFPNAPVFDFLHAQTDLNDYRVAKDRVPIPHDAGIIYGFKAADGYDLTTERTRLFTADLAEDRPDGVMFLAEKILQSADRRFDMLNVKYLLATAPSLQFDALQHSSRFMPVFTGGPVAVFQNKSVLPRFFAVPASGIEVIREPQAQLERVKQLSFDPQRSVIFSDSPDHSLLPDDDHRTVTTDIKDVVEGINGSRFTVHSNTTAVVVASQMYYPGWKATINGRQTPVYVVDYALTGIVVPAGTSEVHLFFRPFTFELGAVISAFSALAILLLADIRVRM